MTAPSVTLRSLKNEDTGIDISVPRFQEEEAPLGGISILYEISVLTKLDLFKTRLHKTGDVVQFTLFKAYREIEDLYNKLYKKYPKAGLPPVPKASSSNKYTADEKVEALDIFMHAVAKNVEICYSSTFTQFIGINSQRLPSFSVPPTKPVDNFDTTNDATLLVESTGIKKETSQNNPEVFPKVKNYATEKGDTTAIKNVDLFEEEKLTKGTNLNLNSGVKTSSSQGGLFDDFEDESLFSTKPPTKEPVVSQDLKRKETPVILKKPEAPKRKGKEPPSENVDDSQIIIKDRKQAEMSLFNEQDLGEYITKEEEALFLVTSPSAETKKNSLLFSENEILSPVDDNSLNENLEDLLNLEPLPNSPFSRKKSQSEEETHKAPSSEPERPKPVPLPRKKSLGKIETDSKQKPEVMPRKVFLNKTSDSSKPEVTLRPPVPAKPTLPPAVQAKPAPPTKPKPPPKKPKPNVETENKTMNLDAANANNTTDRTENVNKVSDLATDLKDLDILKYIEQEEKSLDVQLNLFD